MQALAAGGLDVGRQAQLVLEELAQAEGVAAGAGEVVLVRRVKCLSSVCCLRQAMSRLTTGREIKRGSRRTLPDSLGCQVCRWPVCGYRRRTLVRDASPLRSLTA
jgi:hypothetical protein